MALPRRLRLMLRDRAGLALAAALLLAAANAATLVWLYSLPMPDDSTLPGRAPTHDVGPGGAPTP